MTAVAGRFVPDVRVSHRKPHLPEKNCQRCGRPMVWRKRWERCWEQVRFCSEACRRGTQRGRALARSR
jgi:hypothetical protein